MRWHLRCGCIERGTGQRVRERRGWRWPEWVGMVAAGRTHLPGAHRWAVCLDFDVVENLRVRGEGAGGHRERGTAIQVPLRPLGHPLDHLLKLRVRSGSGLGAG